MKWWHRLHRHRWHLRLGLLHQALRYCGLAAGAPAIRNQADYGLFAGGTWGGMNLAQTVRGLAREDRARCAFSTAIEEIGATHPGIGDKALHLPESAWRSRACLDASVAAVAQLTVPVIAILGGMLFLGEVLEAKTALASALVLGGVAVSVLRRRG